LVASLELEQPRQPSPVARKVVVELKTLDGIVAANGRMPDLVKIDAEGFDLKVLGGASTLFGKVEIFLVEAMVSARVYENSLSAVIRKMDAARATTLWTSRT
jgi:Methyltransferase FkbM domain